jgi:poly(3-hydroxybutyrate) depolymerase
VEVVPTPGLIRVALACALFAGCNGVAHAAPLPQLAIDRSQVTVSGLSSGGYMATQLHVAWSSVFGRGVGVVAAGPYYCAQGLAALATTRCLARDSAPPVDALVATVRGWAAAAWVDPLANLRGTRIYLFAGARDSVVVPALVADLKRFYAAFVPAPQIAYRSDVPAEHGMPTDDFGSACGHRGLPFVIDCDFDLAGEMLKHLYGALAPRSDGALQGAFVEFEQHEFIAAGLGLGAKGWLFVPRDCAAGAACRLHVALHGCGQNIDDIGDTYVRRTGYNRWADSNRIVVLYPQTGAPALHSCWDWWGYTGADYAQKSAPQAGAIVAMVERLAGVAARCHRALNGVHVWAGRAIWGAFGAAVAAGSRQSLGGWLRSTSLRESPAGHFAQGNC